ncbi:MAG TPA: nucleotidyltransferase family protein [Hyphomicrobiaceae bacterium]|nr:nucleotidyltransferase family protein [Hyphomicrobiaceae bacterium]
MAEPTHIAAIVLAAGRSTRMGAANKLLADIGGKPMVRHVVEAALASQAHPVLVVTGHQADEVRAALARLDVAVATNPDFATGLSSSLKAGIRALPKHVAGALVLLGDMPRIEAAHLDAMIAAWASDAGQTIVVPVHQGQRGNPVLWPADLFDEMLALEGDVGARTLMIRHTHRVREIELGTDAIGMDVDTPDALARLRDAGRSA